MSESTPIAVGDKVKVTKGSKALDIAKYTSAYVREITPMGAEFGHCVKVKLEFLSGFTRAKTLYARHINRLCDAEIRLNNGNPDKFICIARK